MIRRPVKSDSDSSSLSSAEEIASALKLFRTLIGGPPQEMLLDPDQRPSETIADRLRHAGTPLGRRRNRTTFHLDGRC